jgi:predicted ArsR family transcriptional regulator
LARAVIDELALGTRASSRAVMAGERWGRATVEAGPRQGRAGSPGKRLVELLDASGFAPRIGDPAALKPTIGLHRCPFGSLAVDQPEVVCGVHLGLMRGALEALDEAADGVTLEPFVEPSLCVVHLTPRLLQKA